MKTDKTNHNVDKALRALLDEKKGLESRLENIKAAVSAMKRLSASSSKGNGVRVPGEGTYARMVYDSVREANEAVTAKDVAAALAWESTDASQVLSGLHSRGVLKRKGKHGNYHYYA